MKLLRILPFRFLNSRMYMNENFWDGLKKISLENITWTSMGKQTVQAKFGTSHSVD